MSDRDLRGLAIQRGCLRASQRVLPQLEALAVNSPQPKQCLRHKNANGIQPERVLDAQTRPKNRKKNGKFIIGSKESQNFEMNNYCRTDNSQECLAEAAKKGFIEKILPRQNSEECTNNNSQCRNSISNFFQPNKRGEFPPISTAKPNGISLWSVKYSILRHPFLISGQLPTSMKKRL